METSQQELDRGTSQEHMRCPSCGGLNRADAEWCGQCLRRFAPRPEPEPEPSPEALEEAPDNPGPRQLDAGAAPEEAWVAQPGGSAYASYIDTATDSDSEAPDVPAVPSKPPPPEAVGTKRGAFTVTETGVVWTCRSCDTENPLALSTCSVCGTRFADTVNEEASTRVERDPNTVAMISLFFPGAGHGYLGSWGQAVARGVLSIWVIFTAVMGIIQKSGLITVVFGFTALGLWLLAAHDSYREAQHNPTAVILKGKTFMYLVLGLLFLLMVLLMGAGIRAS
ncbi:MAG: hypothetical protein ACRDLB_10885 [Actinomycetota bacterium]